MPQAVAIPDAGSSGRPLTSAAAIERLTASLLSSSAAPETAPVKRGPGRPRKSEIRAVEAAEPEGAPAEDGAQEASDPNESLPEGEGEDESEGRESEDESGEGAEDEDVGEQFEVRVNGRTERVTLDELVKGYSREADYRHKTTQVAEERKAIEAERTAAQEELARRSQMLDQFLGYAMTADPILAEAQNVDWEKLSQDDPTKYVQLQAALQKRGQLYQSWQAQQQEQQRAEMAKVLAREREELVKKIPEAADRDKWAGEEKGLMTYLKGAGLSDREIGGLWDHRIVVLARKAMLYDRLQDGREVAKKKVAMVPKVVRPGVAQPRGGDSSRVQEARSRFNSTRSSKDAVALLETQLLGRN